MSESVVDQAGTSSTDFATKDFKHIRLDGDALVNMYKSNSADILDNESISEKRQQLMKDCEQLLVECPSNKNLVDYIWKLCFYEVISAFKSTRKRFNSTELDALQKFLHNGIDYFDSLGQRFICTQYRCLLFKGDLLRYEHKMVKTEDHVLNMAEACYTEAVRLEPQTGTSYSKLACIYDKSPHIALSFLLRAVANKTTSAIASLQKLNTKNLPSNFASVFKLSQEAFSGNNFQDALNKFKEFMDTYTSLPANIIIQNIHVVCVLSIAFDSEKYDEKLKLLVPVIAQYLNVFVPLLIEQLGKNNLLQQRRNCPSPFEDEDDDSRLSLDDEPNLYENVLFPIIPLVLTLNEWVGSLSNWLGSLKFSVGNRMTCQSVLFNFAELLNCLIDILGYRVEEEPNTWPRAVNYLATHPALLKKSQAFGVLIDCLKKSIGASDHPLDYQTNFKCTLLPKEAKEHTPISIKEFQRPDCLIVSLDSWLLHWPKIIFLLDQFENLTVLMSASTNAKLEEKSAFWSDYKQCGINIRRFEELNRCLVYEDSVGSAVQVATMLNEAGDVSKIYLLMEQAEPEKEKLTLPEGVSCCSANELYSDYCKSIKLDPAGGYLPFLANTFQAG